MKPILIKKTISFYFLITAFLFSGNIYAQTKVNQFELAKKRKNEKIICHHAYCFVYSENHEQAKWVAYKLTKDMLQNNVKRNNKFIPDPKVTTETANNSDYKGSGYDRGHLVPAADMCFSQITMEESFYFSNISPQELGFNRGIWKSLENKTREYAKSLDNIYITTGPVLTNNLNAIGKNNVSIPEKYYKAILYVSDTSIQAIGFLLPNKKIDSNRLFSYALCIDDLEEIIDINLFYKLPFFVERKTEKKLNLPFWNTLNL